MLRIFLYGQAEDLAAAERLARAFEQVGSTVYRRGELDPLFRDTNLGLVSDPVNWVREAFEFLDEFYDGCVLVLLPSRPSKNWIDDLGHFMEVAERRLARGSTTVWVPVRIHDDGEYEYLSNTVRERQIADLREWGEPGGGFDREFGDFLTRLRAAVRENRTVPASPGSGHRRPAAPAATVPPAHSPAPVEQKRMPERKRLLFPKLRALIKIRRAIPSTRPEYDDVHLGIALPNQVAPGEEFVIRISAYAESFRENVRNAIAAESPDANWRDELETCRWKQGTSVSVSIRATGLELDDPVQTFSWNGSWHLLRFDALVSPDVESRRLVLKLDVAVEGIQILSSRPELQITTQDAAPATGMRTIEMSTPNTAFASYSSRDQAEVLSRVRSVVISTGMDVFVDRASILPARKWKRVIKDEIANREIFWLFWSRNAMDSEEVDWEWRRALRTKAIDCIQPHPLEPPDLAPPPEELRELQFGGMFESYLSLIKRG